MSDLEKQVAEALRQYESSGLCHWGKQCDMCDCPLSWKTPEQQEVSWAMELDRARAVLAAIADQNPAKPTQTEVLNVLIENLGHLGGGKKVVGGWVLGGNSQQTLEKFETAARAVLALLQRNGSPEGAVGPTDQPLAGLEDNVQPWEHEGHHPIQHRDGNPPWCPKCGWSSPTPAVAAYRWGPSCTQPATCGRSVGTRPWWMGVDQYDPCHCIREPGHDGDCWCKHTEPDSNQEDA